MRSTSRNYDRPMLLNLSKTLWPLFLNPSCPLFSPIPGPWLRIPSSASTWLYGRSNKELPTFPSVQTQPPRGLEDAKTSRLSLMMCDDFAEAFEVVMRWNCWKSMQGVSDLFRKERVYPDPDNPDAYRLSQCIQLRQMSVIRSKEREGVVFCAKANGLGVARAVGVQSLPYSTAIEGYELPVPAMSCTYAAGQRARAERRRQESAVGRLSGLGV